MRAGRLRGAQSSSEESVSLLTRRLSVCNTVVSGPVEHVRIRLQTQPSGTPLYAGPIDCVRKLYAANGIAGVFKGQLATVWRDGVGYG